MLSTAEGGGEAAEIRVPNELNDEVKEQLKKMGELAALEFEQLPVVKKEVWEACAKHVRPELANMDKNAEELVKLHEAAVKI